MAVMTTVFYIVTTCTIGYNGWAVGAGDTNGPAGGEPGPDILPGAIMAPIIAASRDVCRAWYRSQDVSLAVGRLADVLAEHDGGERGTNDGTAQEEGHASAQGLRELHNRPAVQAGGE